MDGDITPVGYFIRLAIPGQQGCLLLLVEDHQGKPSRRPVDTASGHLTAPPSRRTPEPGRRPPLRG
jgi:hypothetical protein